MIMTLAQGRTVAGFSLKFRLYRLNKFIDTHDTGSLIAQPSHRDGALGNLSITENSDERYLIHRVLPRTL